jgi:hypothetical protein
VPGRNPPATVRPLSVERVVDELADWLVEVGDRTPGRAPRIGVDGPPPTEPQRLVDPLAAPLQLRGRRLVHVRAEYFWRDASLRLEHGRQDVDAFLEWLDTGALRREVLQPVDSYLPSLRDPVTNRATRASVAPLPRSAVLVVSGPLLLGAGLPFDASVHLAMSAAARRRRMPADEAWTLPAYDRYDAEVAPAHLADVVVRLDDPARPAVIGLPAR